MLALMAPIGPGRDAAYEAELIDQFELEPDRRTRTCSTGNRQKVALVTAFSTRAPVLVMGVAGLLGYRRRDLQT